MRRQRRSHNYAGDNYNDPKSEQVHNSVNAENDLELDHIPQPNIQSQTNRFENTIEAQVGKGDTLQALALRFHCTVADIKRLNKIDKDNEIYARKVVKIPVNAYSVLLENFPAIHKSGNNSPKNLTKAGEEEPYMLRNPLEDARLMLNEKLIVASVNASEVRTGSNIALNLKISGNGTGNNTDDKDPLAPTVADDLDNSTMPLLNTIIEDETVAYPRPIRGPSLRAIDWSGSDCDMSWVCLFVFILALCFVIPLLYVVHLAEHHGHNQLNSTIH